MSDIENAVVQGETLSLRKTNSDRYFKVEAKKVDQTGMTGAYAKSRVEAAPVVNTKDIESRPNLSLIFKKAEVYYDDCLFGGEKSTQSIAERYFERWKYLKSIGIPVVSSMRVVDDERIAMGNMTIGGGQFIGKDTYWWCEPSVHIRGTKGLTQEERLFLNVDPASIKQEISRVLNIAWRNGVRLPDTDEEFSILVRPDGAWSLVVKDIGTINKLSEDDNQMSLEKELHKRVDYIRSVLNTHKDVK